MKDIRDHRLVEPHDVDDLARNVRHIAELGVDVLLTGETGTGKDTLAQQIHNLSGRKGRLVAMNSAAIPESLAESELFGVMSGAYTGADRSRMGYIEAAQSGTLYLDEIDSMPLALQAKLLRVLETRTVERLGSTTAIALDLCVIASAQRSLSEMVERGAFRRDLFFRLNVIALQLPALRDRRCRIVPLFTQFIAASARQLGRDVQVVTPAVRKVLLQHEWPGNIRELKSAANRFVLGAPLLDATFCTEPALAIGLKAQLRIIEKVLIQESLKRHCNSIEAVSLELGIPRRTLYHRMKALGV